MLSSSSIHMGLLNPGSKAGTHSHDDKEGGNETDDDQYLHFAHISNLQVSQLLIQVLLLFLGRKMSRLSLQKLTFLRTAEGESRNLL
jgi:hypothetical protein